MKTSQIKRYPIVILSFRTPITPYSKFQAIDIWWLFQNHLSTTLFVYKFVQLIVFSKRNPFQQIYKKAKHFQAQEHKRSFMFGTTVSKKCSENFFQRAEANNMTIRRNVFKAKTCKKFRCKFIHKFLTKKSTYKNLNPQMALESSNINRVSVALSLSGCTIWLPRERSGVWAYGETSNTFC